MNTNCENKNELETNDIIKNTETQFLKNECQDTGKVWKKNCPKCGKELYYSNKYKLKYSLGKLCNSCRQLFCDKKDIYERNCPVCNNVIKYKSRVSFLLANRKNRICLNCKSKQRVLPQQKFIDKSKLIHKNKYCYLKSTYVNHKTKLTIICPIHGEFSITPNNHLNGKGCKKCRDSNHKLTIEEFIKRSTIIHKNLYDYSKFVYVKSSVKGIIICPIHGEFLQIPGSHLRGSGCSKCHFYKLHKLLNPSMESKSQNQFLDFMEIKNRNVPIENFIVDGLEGNIIYEFLGDYWHGNPDKFSLKDRNVVVNKTFKELYDYTFKRLKILKKLGYVVKYIWENDWKNYIKNKKNLNIQLI